MWRTLLLTAPAHALAFPRIPRNAAVEPWACYAAVDDENQRIGVGSMLLYALDALLWCETQPGAVPTVYWNGCTFCPNDVDNAWDLWFEPVGKQHGKQQPLSAHLCPAPALVVPGAVRWNRNFVGAPEARELFEQPDLKRVSNILSTYFGVHSLSGNPDGMAGVTPPLRAMVNGALRRHVRLVPRLQRVVDEFAARQLHGHFVVAVHIRATDHVYEFAQESGVPCGIAMTCGLAPYYRAIDEVLAQRRRWASRAGDERPTRIFAAADNNEAIRNLTARYGEDVVVHFRGADSVRSSDSFDSHGNGWEWRVWTQTAGQAKLVDAALIDTWLLAQGDHIVHWDSALPKLAEFLNLDMVDHYVPGPDETADDATPLDAAALRSRTAERAEAEQRAVSSVAALADAPPCAGHASCGADHFCALLLLDAAAPPQGRCVPCARMQHDADRSDWRELLHETLPLLPPVLSALAPWGLPLEECALDDEFARDTEQRYTVDVTRNDFRGHCPKEAAQNFCEFGHCRDLEVDAPPASQLPRLPGFWLQPRGKGETPTFVRAQRRERRRARQRHEASLPADTAFICETGDGERLGAWKTGLSVPPHFGEGGCVALCREKWPEKTGHWCYEGHHGVVEEEPTRARVVHADNRPLLGAGEAREARAAASSGAEHGSQKKLSMDQTRNRIRSLAKLMTAKKLTRVG
jgi:hypothetical protein